MATPMSMMMAAMMLLWISYTTALPVQAAVLPEAWDIPPTIPSKAAFVTRLLMAKEASNLTFTQIAKALNLTNVYTTQLFLNQHMLSVNAAANLAVLMPEIAPADLAQMQKSPSRRYDPYVLQDPTAYRLNEAMSHASDAIKLLINEEFGDGIMSAIGFYMTLERGVGLLGEARVKLVLNGKYLVFTEQTVATNVVGPVV